MDYYKFKESNCKNCHKCIRHCQVKAISFSKNQAHIVPDECILCGECFVTCPQNANEIRDDLKSTAGYPVHLLPQRKQARSNSLSFRHFF